MSPDFLRAWPEGDPHGTRGPAAPGRKDQSPQGNNSSPEPPAAKRRPHKQVTRVKPCAVPPRRSVVRLKKFQGKPPSLFFQGTTERPEPRTAQPTFWKAKRPLWWQRGRGVITVDGHRVPTLYRAPILPGRDGPVNHALGSRATLWCIIVVQISREGAGVRNSRLKKPVAPTGANAIDTF